MPTATATASDSKLEGAVEATTDGIVTFNKRVVTETKKAGNATLDAYETAAKTIAEYTEKVGAASPIPVVSTITQAQAKLTREVTTAYAKAARKLLS
jgi:hypothetical protein